ncbi:MAG: UDP-N-acetylglucosamine--N-acetylmuramyl-(pentapeptide) pyrophosphoryl-undecaprenol N-acetylglucosamine transferase [Sphaerochaetaceae bacterium]|nr:UDP-N-acetylglucosamine--N-acetylmuramyl-(pentapeptide) pyrophosphoryl-undecaprenol N-acetylglucosamine transferase [Sphaerochaetaceae bacterium]HHU88926.1 UDP-N-acetylglucosamine--N-acetylmuramyl-(pentapeptide) pyrophosphoryl-undecaprenol N-acetylglucosamine transferase [Spirochaetales bacterium]
MKVCFTGGGTGGHVFPAFAVDAELKVLVGGDYERFWIGSGSPQERQWVEQEQIPYYSIKSGKLRRYFSWQTFPDLFNIVVGLFQALKILKKERPDILFSKGGYVSVPPVVAARLLKIPSITHESDALPGLATRLNSLFVDKVCIPFEGAEGKLPPKKVVVTGVPTRLSLERAQTNKPPEGSQKRVVVLGGSQGAQQINTLIWDNLERLLPLCEVFHQTGSGKLIPLEREGYHPFPFLYDELEEVLHSATLVISRSGATALADFLELEKPMILIPLNLQASRGDQVANAERLEAAGAAIIISGDDGDELIQAVTTVLNEEKFRETMIERGKSLYIKGSATKIAKAIVGLKGGEQNG